MTKYYKLSLSPTPAGVMDSSGTNVLSKSSFKGGNVELVWELADTHIANQFYNITEAAIADEYRWLHWNLYDANQSVNMQLLINTLNTDIDTQGADPLLKLSITDSIKEMHDKLNEVHFVFEKQLIEITDSPDHTYTEESNPAVEILERLNKTVHEIEANLSRFFAVEKLHEKQYFLVICPRKRMIFPSSSNVLCCNFTPPKFCSLNLFTSPCILVAVFLNLPHGATSCICRYSSSSQDRTVSGSLLMCSSM